MCGGTPGGTLSAEELARHWWQISEPNFAQSGLEQMGSEEQEVIALRVSQVMQDFCLRKPGVLHEDEWVHGMLLEQSKVCIHRASSHINQVIKTLLQQMPSALLEIFRLFQAADPGTGRFNATHIAKLYRQGTWNFCPITKTLFSDEAKTRDPETLAQEALELMDVDSSGFVTYAGFAAFCCGLRKREVRVNFYDLSKGLASTVAPWLLGENLEGVWHTAAVIFDKEYFYGGEIFCDEPGKTSFGTPTKSMSIGYTLCQQRELHRFLIENARMAFNRGAYDAALCNCNHFTDQVCAWLTGQHMAREVVQQSESLLQLPTARLIRPFIQRWLGNLDNPKSSQLPEMNVDFQDAEAACRPLLTDSSLATPRPGSAAFISSQFRTGGCILGRVCETRLADQGRPVTRAWAKYLDISGSWETHGCRRVKLRSECVSLDRLSVASFDQSNGDESFLRATKALEERPTRNTGQRSWSQAKLSLADLKALRQLAIAASSTGKSLDRPSKQPLRCASVKDESATWPPRDGNQGDSELVPLEAKLSLETIALCTRRRASCQLSGLPSGNSSHK